MKTSRSITMNGTPVDVTVTAIEHGGQVAFVVNVTAREYDATSQYIVPAHVDTDHAGAFIVASGENPLTMHDAFLASVPGAVTAAAIRNASTRLAMMAADLFVNGL